MPIIRYSRGYCSFSWHITAHNASATARYSVLSSRPGLTSSLGPYIRTQYPVLTTPLSMTAPLHPPAMPVNGLACMVPLSEEYSPSCRPQNKLFLMIHLSHHMRYPSLMLTLLESTRVLYQPRVISFSKSIGMPYR